MPANDGVRNPQGEICEKSDTLDGISIKIYSGECTMNEFKNYKERDFYKLEDIDTKKCIDSFAVLGGSLSEYEVVKCYVP